MTAQLEFDLPELGPVKRPSDLWFYRNNRFIPATKDEAFNWFHEQNPQVYDALVRLARHLRYDLGWPRASMKALFEHLRWRYAVQTKGERWKLNNTYTAHYARLIMDREPDLAGFFETRGDRDG